MPSDWCDVYNNIGVVTKTPLAGTITIQSTGYDTLAITGIVCAPDSSNFAMDFRRAPLGIRRQQYQPWLMAPGSEESLAVLFCPTVTGTMYTSLTFFQQRCSR